MPPAIAFCPTPPLLVPQLAAGAAAELDPLRTACREAVRRLLATRPDEVVVIATGPVSSQFPPGTTGTTAGYGVPLTATLPGGPPVARDVPLGVTLGAWLLAGADVPCSAVVAGPEPVPAPGAALLVMGDGSARRSEKAPGYVDPRAEPFDAAVARALATGDAAALAGLDPALGAALLAGGVPAWRLAARAALAATAPDRAGSAGGVGPAGGVGSAGGPYRAELLYDDAPYGVGYFVATWIAP